MGTGCIPNLGTAVDYMGVDTIFNEPTTLQTGRIRGYLVMHLDSLHISEDPGWTVARTGSLHNFMQDSSSPQ